MSFKTGFRGQTYDDTYPLYVKVTADLVVNSKTMQTLTLASLQAAMTLEGYSAPVGEIAPSANWENTHRGWWLNDDVNTPTGQPPVNQPTPGAPTITQIPAGDLPITGDSTGSQTAMIDLDFHGTVVAGTFTITYDIGSGDVDITCPVLATDTPVQASEKVAAAIDAVASFGGVRMQGTQVTVVPASGVQLVTMTVAFA